MGDLKQTSRRDFIKQSSLLGVAAIAVPADLNAAATSPDTVGGDNCTFLFQGDSITDGNRTRNNDWNHVMGHGYAYLIASRLWFDFPVKKFHFFNRGISGNKVTDLAQRWQPDTLDIKPNVLSILVGINDVDAVVHGNKDFTAASYENDYRALLTQTKQSLPEVQLVICEPFILPVGRVKDNWAEFERETSARRKTAKDLATEFDAIFVPLQDTFNQALKRAPADYWIWDGIHPMPGGHELIAREWIKQVGKKLKFVKTDIR
ncbi:MAG: SGNH/GDSL hydrolase family protein [Bacteroidota bacterium]